MHAAVRAEGLLAPSSARFSVDRDKRCRLCKGLGSLLSYPLLVATLCFNPAKGPETASRSAECRGSYHVPCTRTCTGSSHTLSIGGGPPNVDFPLTFRLILVWIRIRVSMMVIVFVISVWIRRLRPIFPLFQVELCLAVRERWLTAANFDRRSHCPGAISIFLLSPSTSAFNTLQAAPGLWFILEEKETSTNRHTKLKSLFTLDRRSGSAHRPAHACVRALRGQY